MAKVGSTLSATPASVTGEPTPVRSWQWLRDGSPVSGATAADYYVQAADEGARLSVRQIETNFVGVASATSAQTATVGAYDPGTLFESGEVGAWYDPSDLTTVFQDAAGTTPATVGDPVGLILDKSKGLTLGADVVVNGDFATTADWVVGSDWDLSNGYAENTTGLNTHLRPSVGPLTIGKWYKVSFDLIATTGQTRFRPNFVTTAGQVLFTTTGSKTAIFEATGTTFSFFENSGLPGTIIDNVVIRELPGNHATQTTSAARPVLQQSGSLYYLDFDGVDDYLTTATFASGAQSQPNTIALAAELVTSLNVMHVDSEVGGLGGRHLYYNVGSELVLYTNSAITYGGSNDGSASAWLALFDGGSTYLRRNGVAQSPTSGLTVGTNTWSGITMGSRNTGSQNSASNFYAFVGINRTLTAGEITDLETYLAAKSGVTLP